MQLTCRGCWWTQPPRWTGGTAKPQTRSWAAGWASWAAKGWGCCCARPFCHCWLQPSPSEGQGERRAQRCEAWQPGRSLMVQRRPESSWMACGVAGAGWVSSSSAEEGRPTQSRCSAPKALCLSKNVAGPSTRPAEQVRSAAAVQLTMKRGWWVRWGAGCTALGVRQHVGCPHAHISPCRHCCHSPGCC